MKLKNIQVMNTTIRNAVKHALGAFGVTLVARDWGPRGFARCFARARLQGFLPATVIDVGASDGRWARECAKIFPAANYALFDALPEHAADLQSFASTFPGTTFWNGAIGAEEGRVQINVHGHQTSIYKSADFLGTPLDVDVRRLDSFIEPMNIRGPILLKADVQGHELEVLRGAERTLQMTDMILLELSFRRIYDRSPLAHEVIADLGVRGYRIYDICSYAQRVTDRELLQADVVFARADSRLFAEEGWR